MNETRERFDVFEPNFRFFIVAWLPGESHMKRIAMNGDTIMAFKSPEGAMAYYTDYMTPDWECEILPMPTLSMATDDEQQEGQDRIKAMLAKEGLTSKQ